MEGIVFVRNLFAIAALACVALAPAAALANTVDASLIPDGTYTVKVEKVVDPQHMTVKMDNGIETTLSAKAGVTFGKIKDNDTVKLSVISGKVPLYQVQ
ncbi:MAG: hypothetical protein ACXVAG_13480 [Vulcanimicrobiaceae bacterium]